MEDKIISILCLLASLPWPPEPRLESCSVGGVKPGSPYGVVEKASGGHPLSAQHRHRGEHRWEPPPQLRQNAPARWRLLQQIDWLDNRRLACQLFCTASPAPKLKLPSSASWLWLTLLSFLRLPFWSTGINKSRPSWWSLSFFFRVPASVFSLFIPLERQLSGHTLFCCV